jgi:hypothetical protein
LNERVVFNLCELSVHAYGLGVCMCALVCTQ